MGRTNGSKNAGDYFGAAPRKAPDQQGGGGGLRRLFSIFTSSNARQEADAPSARSSASFLLQWRSTRAPADVLTIDQGTPSLSFNCLRVEDRWESVATDIMTAAREAPPSRERDELEEDGLAADRPRLNRLSIGRQREDDYRQQPHTRAEMKPQPQPADPTARERGREVGVCGVREAQDDAEDEEQRRAAERRHQLMVLQQLQRQATMREVGEQQKPQKLEYQPWDAPQPRALPNPHAKQTLLPTPPIQNPVPPPPKLEYTPSQRHPDTFHQPQCLLPPGQGHQSLLLPAQHAHQSQQLHGHPILRQETSSRELLRLPPCSQPHARQDPPPLVLRERAATIGPNTSDSPLRGASRRLIEAAAAGAAEEEATARGRTGGGTVAGLGGMVGDEDEDLEDDALALMPRSSLDRGRSLRGTSFGRRVLVHGVAEEGRATTPNRYGAGSQARCGPAPPMTAAVSAAAAPLLQRESALRTSVASMASVATANGVNVSVDNPSPSRRTSSSGNDSMTRRAALLREACNGASSMRAQVQRLLTNSNNGSSCINGGNGIGTHSSNPTSVRRPAVSSSGVLDDSFDSGISPESSQVVHPREPSRRERSSHPGFLAGQSALSVRVRHDLENRVAAEEANGSCSGSPSARPHAGAPRWQQMIQAASAAAAATATTATHDTDSGSSRSSSVIRAGVHAPVAAPPPPHPLLRGDTCRTLRAVTPAAKTGRVLQRANTQPAKLRFGMEVNGEEEDEEEEEEDGGNGTLSKNHTPPTGATGAAPAAAQGGSSHPPTLASSVSFGRRAALAVSAMAPVPPPPRVTAGGGGTAAPVRRVSEASAVSAVTAPPAGAGVHSVSGSGVNGAAGASPRLALAERARDRNAGAVPHAPSISGAPSPPPPALDSPPMPPVLPPVGGASSLFPMSSFGRRAQMQLHESIPAVSASPSRAPRHSSPLGDGVQAPGGAGSPLPTYPAPPQVGTGRVSMPGGGGGRSSSGGPVVGPYDQLLEALRGPLPAVGYPTGARKVLEGEVACSGNGSAGTVPAPIEPMRLGPGGMPRPRRVGHGGAGAAGAVLS